MSLLDTIIRADLQEFSAYRAIAQRERLGDTWLNANELSFPTSLDFDNIAMNRYPHRWPESLLQSLARYYGVATDQLLLGRGSDEAIDLLIRLCCRPGQDNILICPPTFHIYQVYAQLQQAGIIKIPLGSDFEFPLTRIQSRWQPDIKLIFICSPNNPTGNLVPAEHILALCTLTAGQALVVVDEAYIEFARTPSMIAYLQRAPNLVILRTFSKAFGLAGARCGVAIAHPELIAWLRKISAPYPLPTPTIHAVQMALSDTHLEKVQQNIKTIRDQRDFLQQQLIKSPLIEKIWPSEGNFLLIKTTDASMLIQRCLQHGIVIRDYSQEPELHQCVRISIGTPEENAKLCAVLMDNRSR